MPRNYTDSKLNLIVTLSFIAFVSVQISFIWFGDNSFCFRYFGCNAGFFGYDAFFHLFGGVLFASFFVWLARKYQSFNLFQNNAWKNFIILLAIVALLGIGWEFIEFGHDHVLNRFKNLYAIKILHLEKLVQPTNSDTVGDLFFDLAGAAIAASFL